MKANLPLKEPALLEYWDKINLYKKLRESTKGKEKFILHDGPPYANGDLHLGHALNKILKDIVCRLKFQDNFDVDFVPGWDCHGLPIEWKVEEKFKKKGLIKDEIDVIQFREECRNFAEYWVNEQKKQFCRFGIQTDWKNIYNREIRVEFIKFIRSEKKFKNIKQLTNQIKKDIKVAKRSLN